MNSRHQKDYSGAQTDQEYQTEASTSRHSQYPSDSEKTRTDFSKRTSEQPEPRKSMKEFDRERQVRIQQHRSHSRSPEYASKTKSRSSGFNHNQDTSRKRHLDDLDEFHPLKKSSNTTRVCSPNTSLTTSHSPIAQERSSTHHPILTSLGKSGKVNIGSESESPDNQLSEQKDEPNFQPSGKLAAETKTFKGVVLKYHEPPEARKPSKKWRLYVFKVDKEVDLFHLHNQSAYLFGRDRIVVDIPIDHPSSSKQHAVIQYRQVSSTNEFGDSKTTIKPFIIDLESANGTYVNKEKIPVSRYYELQSGDVIKFGFSTREYVLIPET